MAQDIRIILRAAPLKWTAVDNVMQLPRPGSRRGHAGTVRLQDGFERRHPGRRQACGNGACRLLAWNE